MKKIVFLLIVSITFLAGCKKDSVEPFTGSREARLKGINELLQSKLGKVPTVTRVVFTDAGKARFKTEEAFLGDAMVIEARNTPYVWDLTWSQFLAPASSGFAYDPINQTSWFIGTVNFENKTYSTCGLAVIIKNNGSTEFRTLAFFIP